MRKLRPIIFVITILLSFGLAQDENYDTIRVTPQNAKVNVGDTVEYEAVYFDTAGNPVDTTFEWSVEPDSIGEFGDNLFFALQSGEGEITARLDSISAVVEIEVEADEDDDDDIVDETESIEIHPKMDEITVGDSLYYYVLYKDSNGAEIDTNAVFTFAPDSLAEFEGDLLITKAVGQGMIVAQLGDLADTLEVEIEGEDNDDDDDDQDSQLPQIQIHPRKKKIALGDSIAINVSYIDTNEVATDTNATLTVIPDSIGQIDDNNVFVAENYGEGLIAAKLDSLTDTLEIIIEEDQSPNNDDHDKYKLKNNLLLSPKDTIVNVGTIIDFQVKYNGENGLQDTTIKWTMEGMDVGDLSNGELTTTAPGFALVKAQIGENIGSAFVIVEEVANDSVTNTIQITRPHMSPNKEYRIMKELEEGELWRIGGMPAPLNVYNGGFIYFPKGSLDENIQINISLPDFAEISMDSVAFGNQNILAGVKFDVYVDDSLAEPYYFNTPLIVGLVYKRGLLRKLNIEPESLRLYYVNEESDSVEFDSTGIENSTLAYYRNLIFSNVEHFSTIALKGDQDRTAISNNTKIPALPKTIRLQQNYPNPFNPVTNIEYSIPIAMNVRLDIYNVLGQRVQTLVNKHQSAGYYDIQWNASELASGIYLIRLQAEQQSTVKRALLIK